MPGEIPMGLGSFRNDMRYYMLNDHQLNMPSGDLQRFREYLCSIDDAELCTMYQQYLKLTREGRYGNARLRKIR